VRIRPPSDQRKVPPRPQRGRSRRSRRATERRGVAPQPTTPPVLATSFAAPARRAGKIRGWFRARKLWTGDGVVGVWGNPSTFKSLGDYDAIARAVDVAGLS